MRHRINENKYLKRKYSNQYVENLFFQSTYNVETWEGSFHGDSQSRMQDVATTRTTITTTTSCPLN